jgi:hypothetical protein
MLRNHCIKFGAIAVIASLAMLAGNAVAEEKEENEQKVSLKDCPPAVQKTIKEKAGDAKIEAIEKKTEDDKVTYEAKIEKDGKEREFYVAADGKFLGWEDEEKDHSDKDKDKNHKDKDDDKD